LVSAGRDGALCGWDTTSGTPLWKVRTETGEAPVALAMLPNEGRFVTAAGANFFLWDAATGKVIRSTEHDFKGECVALAPSANGKAVTALTKRGHGFTWDLTNFKVQDAFHVPTSATPLPRLSADAKFVTYTAPTTKNVYVRQVEGDKYVSSLPEQ